MKKLIGLLLGFSLIFGTSATAEMTAKIEDWTDRSYKISFRYRDIASNDDGVRVIVGNDGGIVYSVENGSWIPADRVTDSGVYCVASDGENFVAADSDGHILFSEDGNTWTSQIISEDILFEDITYGPQGFVAIGAVYPLKSFDDERRFYHSKDGKVWQEVSTSLGSFSFERVEYMNDLYIAYGNYDDEMAYSTDGEKWFYIQPNLELGSNDLYYQGRYISVGSKFVGDDFVSVVAYSYDLIHWMEIYGNFDNQFLMTIERFENSYFVNASGDEGTKIYYSNDLQTWEEYFSEPFESLEGAAVIDDQLIYIGNNSAVLTISDGQGQLTQHTSNPNVFDVAFNGKTMIAATDGYKYFHSPDGATWYMQDNPFGYANTSIEWTGDHFYTMTPTGNDSGFTHWEFYRAGNDQVWNLVGILEDIDVTELEYLNGRFYAYGENGKIYVSDDCSTWMQADSSATYQIHDMAYYKGLYYAGSMFGELYFSEDGETFLKTKLGQDNDIYSFCSNGKNMIATTYYGHVYMTVDGRNWTEWVIDTTDRLEASIWDGQSYVVFSNYNNYYKTIDGTSFTRHYSNLIKDVSAAIWTGERYMVIGINGNIQTHVPKEFVKVLVDGEPIIFDVAPQIINSRTMIPARAVFEKVGAEVSWVAESESVVIKKDETEIIITINSDIATVNGVQKTLDSPAVVVNWRTLVPVRFIAEELGMNVGWDGDTYTVTLDQN